MAVVSDQTIARAAFAAGFPRDQIATAVAVALAESEGDATAINTRNTNGTIDYGLWQINSIHRADLASGDWRDPGANARMAFAVWTRAGRSWRPWVAWLNGKHLRFMARGAAVATDVVTVARPDGDNPLIPNIIEGPADAYREFAADVGHGLRVITDRDLWIRAGIFAIGAVLLVVAAVGLLWTLGGKSTVRTITKAVT